MKLSKREMSKDRLLALLGEILSRREDGITITVIDAEGEMTRHIDGKGSQAC